MTLIYLFKYCPDQIFWRCISENEVCTAIKLCHSKACESNFLSKKTTAKILQYGFYLMRSNHQRIHWRFQLVQLLGLGLRSSKKLSMDFFKIHGPKWTSRGFVIIKSKPWLIWFMFKRGLLVEPRPLHKDWEKKTRFRQFHLSLHF